MKRIANAILVLGIIGFLCTELIIGIQFGHEKVRRETQSESSAKSLLVSQQMLKCDQTCRNKIIKEFLQTSDTDIITIKNENDFWYLDLQKVTQTESNRYPNKNLGLQEAIALSQYSQYIPATWLENTEVVFRGTVIYKNGVKFVPCIKSLKIADGYDIKLVFRPLNTPTSELRTIYAILS